jgi:hypothetical protein
MTGEVFDDGFCLDREADPAQSVDMSNMESCDWVVMGGTSL